MKQMTLQNMAQACGGTVIAGACDSKKEAARIVIDSREVTQGDVFVAIRGERVDGHQFIPAVFQQGAFAVICEQKPEDIIGPCILVESTRDALRALAAFYLDVLNIPVVGITGSVGKTSTKEMIARVLQQKYIVHKTAGNFNNEIGLPLTVFSTPEDAQVAVLEMGISDFGEMTRLAKIARPNIMVITNIGICHLEYLGTRDGILKAKTEVFDYLKLDATVVLNGDDDKLCTVKAVQGEAPVFYGIGEEAPGEAVYGKKAVYADDIVSRGLRGIDFVLNQNGQSRNAHVAIPGEHNIYNALAAAAVGDALGLTLDEIVAGIAAARTIGGRTNLIDMGDYLVIDDCYNANPVSMRAAIDVLAQADGRTIAVLGDMGELGIDEKKLHYEVGAYLAEKHIDWLFAAGELSRELVRGVEEYPDFTTQFDYFGTDTDALCNCVCDFIQPGDTILVKASHFCGYTRIVEKLTKKS